MTVCRGCPAPITAGDEVHTISAYQAAALEQPDLDGEQFHEDCCPICELDPIDADLILLAEGVFDGPPPAPF